MALPNPHPDIPSVEDCLRAAWDSEHEEAEFLAMRATRALLDAGSHTEAAALLSSVQGALPPWTGVALRDQLADILENIGDLHGALTHASTVDGQRPGDPQGALRVGRLCLKLERFDHAARHLQRAHDWATQIGDAATMRSAEKMLARAERMVQARETSLSAAL